MPMLIPELLCPAGDEAALRAAVDLGADAVYLGYSRFGARASATNFDGDGLCRAVDYAHLYHARVHVTVNTLVKQDELDDVREALGVIQQAGADAVIVQDLGVASLVAREFPALSLHASTQMALCNATDARWALANGFDRVVLARECTLGAIHEVAQTGIETEVFAHGALCTAVSGRCLMSSMAGGRSGNRGRCAQPCRQQFTLGDGGKSALLSLRDLCLLGDLPALTQAGVASLKLEGRLKSAEYVAVVTDVYRRALDKLKSGAVSTDDPDAMRELLQIFNRGGFTHGHAMGAQDAALVSAERVGHCGVPIGTVTDERGGFMSIRLDEALHDGDSLRVEGERDTELRYSGQDVPAGQTARVRLRPGERANVGDRVARLVDAKQLERARNHVPKPIPVSMEATFALGEPMRLVLRNISSDNSNAESPVEVTVLGEIVQAAISRESTREDAEKQLMKLGGTPFMLGEPMEISMSGGLFLPVSALNALRREAVDGLIAKRIEAFASASGSPSQRGAVVLGRLRGSSLPGGDSLTSGATPPSASADTSPLRRGGESAITPQTLAIRCSDLSMSQALLEAGADMLIYEPLDLRPAAFADALDALPSGSWVQLPQQPDEGSLQAYAQAIADRAPRLGGVMLGSVGQLSLSLPLPIVAGEGIPVTNVEAMHMLRTTPLVGFTLWQEWTKAELEAMSPFDPHALLKVYGREPLMLLNHCPERARRGLSEHRESCTLCKSANMACGQENAALTDRMGYRFPLERLQTPRGCVLRVLGALPTLIDDNAARLRLNAGALAHFTDESPQEQLAITRALRAWMAGGESPKTAAIAQAVTSGHWRRGVE